MTRADAVTRLRAASDRLRGGGVRALYLFGSFARDEAGAESDIDLFVDPDYELFDFVALIRADAMLSTELGRAVDLTTRDGLHPRLRPDIEAGAIRIM